MSKICCTLLLALFALTACGGGDPEPEPEPPASEPGPRNPCKPNPLVCK